MVLYFGDRTFRATSWSWQTGDQEPPSADETLAWLIGDDVTTPLPLTPPHLQGAITEPRLIEDDGPSYWAMTAFVAGAGEGCLATLCYSEPGDAAWARTIAASLEHPPADH